MTYKELAKKMKVNQSTAFRWLKRIRTPSAADAERLEQVTGIDRRAWLWPDEYPNPMMEAPSPERLAGRG